VEACANCGKEPSDAGVKLKICTACRLVKYCSVDCQRAHRKQHKNACKRRASELKDELLYGQGLEQHEGHRCPICTLPIPTPLSEHSGLTMCCLKRICEGCNFSVQKRGMFDCAFCRTPMPEDDALRLAMLQKRVDANDPEATFFLGSQYFYGRNGVEKDVKRATELLTQAAEHGSIDAHFELGNRFYNEEGVQDETKAVRHWEKAAMQGHAEARFKLGCLEGAKRNFPRAIRHCLISAKMGNDSSLEMMKRFFQEGFATKQQYAEALEGYQGSLQEMKSPERDEARAALRLIPADQR